jgi:hypothetical protein
VEASGQSVSHRSRGEEWIWLAVDVILLLLVALGIGAVTSWVRFRTAQLPAFSATGDLGIWRLWLAGLLRLIVMVAAFALISALAWALAGRKWGDRRGDWHRLVVRHGVRAARASAPSDREPRGEETAPVGDHAVRILAGFNIAVLCGSSPRSWSARSTGS